MLLYSDEASYPSMQAATKVTISSVQGTPILYK